MIAERLLKFAVDFDHDYKQLNLQSFLQQVVQLCAARPQTTTPVFQQQSRALRGRAEEIIQQTRFQVYPQYYMDWLSSVPYSALLPSRIAEIVISGLTDDVATTMSANEFTAISTRFESAHRELSWMASTMTNFNISVLEVPAGQISIEFKLPRPAFDDVALEFLKWNEKFEIILASFNEFAGAENTHPRLVFTSTTDPVIGYAVGIAAAYGVTQLVNSLLDIAKKSIELHGSIKLMRERNVVASASTLQAEADKLTRADVEEAVEKAFKSLQSSVEVSRRNELNNAISLNAVLLLPAIIDGASISVSPESLDQADGSRDGLLIQELPTLSDLLVNNSLREKDLRTAVRLNGGLNLLRIARPDPQATTPTPENPPAKSEGH